MNFLSFVGQEAGGPADRSLQPPPLLDLQSLSLALPRDPSPDLSPSPSPDPQQLPPALPSQRGGVGTAWPGTWQKNPQCPIQSQDTPANRIQSSINNIPGDRGTGKAWLIAETAWEA